MKYTGSQLKPDQARLRWSDFKGGLASPATPEYTGIINSGHFNCGYIVIPSEVALTNVQPDLV